MWRKEPEEYKNEYVTGCGCCRCNGFSGTGFLHWNKGSLGGTLAAMLAEPGNVRIRHAVIGSSDFDTCGEILARLETKLMVKMIYPLLATGRMHGIL